MVMSMWRVLQAMCLLGLLSETLSQTYEGDFSVNYMDYYNEISEGGQPEGVSPPPAEAVPETTDPPCSVPELSKWDKLFTMLENSQMKENMLLQHSDDLVRVELQGLREDLLRLSAQYSSPCPAPDEGHAHRAEQLLTEALSGLSGRLDAVLEIVREQEERVDGQAVCCDGWKRTAEQLASSLQGAATEGRDLRKRAGIYVDAALGRLLPAGCEMALFFPMRSPKSHAEVIVQGSMQTDALTACLWVKPTQVQDKAVLFSYGTSSNPLELQLLLSGRSVLFTVRGEAHLVEAQGAVEEGEWGHVCATWGSEHGMATLWVDGREAARSPGVAEGHRLHGGGTLVLGQDSSWQGLGLGLMTRFSFQGEPDEQQAFAGKMTGVNVWNRVLGDEEISQQAEQEGRACGHRGNLVAWGVSQITRSGDVQLVF